MKESVIFFSNLNLLKYDKKNNNKDSHDFWTVLAHVAPLNFE